MAVCFFLCKQKTSYELRISDWSSDVCSSDLRAQTHGNRIGSADGGNVRFIILRQNNDCAWQTINRVKLRQVPEGVADNDAGRTQHVERFGSNGDVLSCDDNGKRTSRFRDRTTTDRKSKRLNSSH